jgi:hypothetical protein
MKKLIAVAFLECIAVVAFFFFPNMFQEKRMFHTEYVMAFDISELKYYFCLSHV